jgi:predicted ABC-type ATPase
MANLLAAPNMLPKLSKTSKGAGNTAYTSRATETAASDTEEEVQRPTYETDNFIRTPYGLVNKSAGDFMDFLPSAEDIANLSDAQKANILGGFLPGAAIVEAGGGYAALPKDKDTGFVEMVMGERSPSMLENIKEGNWGIAALQGIGAIGDAFTVIPVIGSVAGTPFKAPNVLRKGIEALGDVKRIEDAAEEAIEFADQMEDFKAFMSDKARYYDPDFQAAVDQHPAVQTALKQMEEIPVTSARDDFATQGFRDNRVFNFGETEVVGYDDAVEMLYERSKRLGYEDDKLPYPGPVTNSPDATKRAVIVLGPPASGKSTIANPIARKFDATIIDPDEAKKLLPEYQGGVGANAVHTESRAIANLVQEIAMEEGDNLVIPTVGGDLDKLRSQIVGLKNRGYQVDLVDVVVPAADARVRMYGRFANTGRIIPASYLDEVGDNPSLNYDILRKEGLADGYTRIDNTAPIEEPRALLEDTREILEGTELRLRDSRGRGGSLRPESANASSGQANIGPPPQGEGGGLAGLYKPEMPVSNEFFDPSDPAYRSLMRN